jgi:hypothetical protein
MTREIKVGDVLTYQSPSGPGKSGIEVKTVDNFRATFKDQHEGFWSFIGSFRERFTHENPEAIEMPTFTRKRKQVYLAGPMRGYPLFNFPAFDNAQADLIAKGFDVVSPADLDRRAGFNPAALPEDTDWHDASKLGFSLPQAIKRDTEALQKCDVIYMLKGWESSKGAKAEKALAEWLGLEVMHEEEPQYTQQVPSVIDEAIRGKHGRDAKLIAEEVISVGSLLVRKNIDYGGSVWKSPVLLPKQDPKSAILVRMSDKIARLARLSSNSAEVEESFEDTLRDLAGYCVLLLAKPK